MKTFALLSILLPAAAYGQTLGQLVGPRVAAILAEGVQGGGQGLYLKQVNGPLLAAQNDRVVFDPANTVAIMPLLYAMDVLRSGAITLDTPVGRYLNGANSCPNPPQSGGAEPLSTALREMMWHSDNARTHAIQSAFQRSNIDLFSRQFLRLPTTTQPQIPGCQTPGRTTLGEMGGVWELIALGNLPTFDRRTFLGLLAGKAQALAESTDYDHIWDTDIPNMMRQEAPKGMTQAQVTQYQNSMDVQYKSGAAVLCRQAECTEVAEDRSIVGWAKIPYCSGVLTQGREYIFGAMITGALDTAWSAGKVTAAQRAFNAGRAELLRELIRDGMGSCYGGDAVLVTPAPNSNLTSRTTIFTWSNAVNATGYRLDIGTVPTGAQLGTIFTTGTNAVVTNLPCDGSIVYARLWTRTKDYENPKDYSFRACSQGGPIIFDPVPASTISSSTVTFKWTAVAGADSYRFNMGSTLGGNDLEAAEPPTNSFTTNNLPTDGRTVFVRVQAHTATGFGPANDFAFNNLTGAAPAVASIVNAVTKLPNLSPACPAVLTGANFAADTTVTLGGTRAQVVGTPAGGQLTFIVPSTAGTGARTVVISSGGATSLPFSISLTDASPAVVTPLMDAGGSPLARSVKPGDTVVLRAVGLGPLGSDGRPVAKYGVEVGGVQASVTTFTTVSDAPGFVQIGIVVPANAPSGTQQVVVKAGTGVSSGVPLLIAGPAIAGLLNGASFDRSGKVAPGSLVALFGSDLATGDKLGMYPEVVLPGGGVITIAGVTAPLFDVVASAGQINLLVPFEAPTTGTAAVVVTNALGTSSALQLQMAPAAPGIFRIGDPNNPQRKNAAALVANTAWRAMPSSMAEALGMPQNCKAAGVNPAAICGEPAAANDPIQIYVTGMGRATANGNTLRTGDVAPANGKPLYRTVETPRVTIGGIDADVSFSGIAPGFAGLYQINVTIPRGAPAGNDVPVVIEIGGVSDSATIAIRP